MKTRGDSRTVEAANCGRPGWGCCAEGAPGLL